MGVTPTYYLADFMSGDLLEPLPVGAVSGVKLTSSLRPGHAELTVDLQAAGFTMPEARAWVDSIRYGTKTLVPVLEGGAQGASTTPREMGEWWLCEARGSYRSPRVTVAGPEWDGYLDSVRCTETIAATVDPVKTARELMGVCYSESQDVHVNLQSWVSDTGARTRLDLRRHTVSYLSVIQDLAATEEGPFEWMTRTGLELDGRVPTRVTRTLEVGQPRLALSRPDVSLEVTAPGEPHASLLDAEWSWDKRAWPSTLVGWGGGAGKDQLGPTWKSRRREHGEPAVNAMATWRTTDSEELQRRCAAAFDRLTPQNTAFAATLRADQYTPRKGEEYGWRTDPSWTQPGREGSAQCAGWSWSSQAPDVYDLDLVEV